MIIDEWRLETRTHLFSWKITEFSSRPIWKVSRFSDVGVIDLPVTGYGELDYWTDNEDPIGIPSGWEVLASYFWGDIEKTADVDQAYRIIMNRVDPSEGYRNLRDCGGAENWLDFWWLGFDHRVTE